MFTLIQSHMDLNQIAASGQCFTWTPLPGGGWRIHALGRVLECAQEGDRFTFSCTEEAFRTVWHDYFDLSADYGAYISAIDPADPCLTAAAAFGGGIRILRQDLWEVMVGFLISQNNNIARITRSMDLLRRRFGDGLAFPSPDDISCAAAGELKALGLGYRAKYLSALSAELAGGGLDELREVLDCSDDEEAVTALMSFCGIGRKVADCILLFGLHRLDAFPSDTHIKQILAERYPAGFPYDRYRGFLGVIQQYLFFYHLRQ